MASHPAHVHLNMQQSPGDMDRQLGQDKTMRLAPHTVSQHFLLPHITYVPVFRMVSDAIYGGLIYTRGNGPKHPRLYIQQGFCLDDGFLELTVTLGGSTRDSMNTHCPRQSTPITNTNKM